MMFITTCLQIITNFWLVPCLLVASVSQPVFTYTCTVVSSDMHRKGEVKYVFILYLFIVLAAGGLLVQLGFSAVICSYDLLISRTVSHSLRACNAFGSGQGSVFPLYFPTVASQYNIHTQHSHKCQQTLSIRPCSLLTKKKMMLEEERMIENT